MNRFKDKKHRQSTAVLFVIVLGVKSPKNLLCFGTPHHGSQPFQIGFLDSFYRLKGLQKSFNGLFSNAWYLVQFALNGTFAPSVSVVGDSKAVGFVSQKLNDF